MSARAGACAAGLAHCARSIHVPWQAAFTVQGNRLAPKRNAIDCEPSPLPTNTARWFEAS